jgi:hypothetical protein
MLTTDVVEGQDLVKRAALRAEPALNYVKAGAIEMKVLSDRKFK